MNRKKFVALCTSVAIMITGMMSSTVYAESNTASESFNYIENMASAEDASQKNDLPAVTSVDSENNIDVFAVYDAHKRYEEASKPDSNEYILKNGMDVSTFQGDIDFNAAKESGIEFVLIRAGYGRETSQVDTRFHENIQKAKEAGLDCGAYWYSYALTPEQAVLEAEACYETIKDYQFEYPIVFDIEEESQKRLSTATISAIIESFCSTLEEKGYYVSLYSYASFLNSKVYQSTLEKYDVWVAHYGVSSPSYTGNYGMWQYTSAGSVSGIKGNVDLDYSYKNYPYLMSKYHLNGF
ncbi:MAG: glycoside hydrolase family 25 protein [Oscillospiraceae bacterium]|nr:glycoside hydrolase family 25 protein [Oscillospiraceae bacterium]